jgi:subtilisin family serine protease
MGINHAKVFNLTGKNIGIGLIDSGVFPHPDIVLKRNCISYFSDLINSIEKPYDDNGHGTFMSGCIASSGSLSSNMYSGTAPDSNLCVIKAFDAAGNGCMSDIIKAIDMLIELKDRYNIRIICLPFEFKYMNKVKANPLEDLIKKAVKMNIAVVTPSGNLGYQPYSIYFPGNMKEAITVGGAYCVENNLENFRVCSFSGRGPTIKEIAKPDILAPAVNITSLAANTSYIPGLKIKSELKVPYSTMSGTSIACALIAGVCAVVLEKTPELSPPDLKSVLCLSTMSLGENKLSQGSGLFIFDKIMK